MTSCFARFTFIVFLLVQGSAAMAQVAAPTAPASDLPPRPSHTLPVHPTGTNGVRNSPSAAVTLAKLRLTGSYNPSITARETFSDTFKVGSLDLCQLHEVEITGQDPVLHTPRLVHVKVYIPERINDPGDLRTVVIVPPIGGVNQIDTGYASELCLLNVRAALLEDYDYENKGDLDLGAQDRESLRAVAAIRHIVEYLQPRRATQFALLGTSAGAIMGSLALSIEPRLNTGALIVGGGNLPNILATSELPEFQTLRDERMKTFGYADTDAYEAALKKAIQIEPLDLARASVGKRVWMMVGKYDHTVPTVDQFALATAFRAASLQTFDGDHVPTVIHTFTSDQQLLGQFLLGNLH